MTEVKDNDNSISPDSGKEADEGSENKRDLVRIVLLSVLLALLVVAVILVALLALPTKPPEEEKYPIIDVKDSDGKWDDRGSVALFENGLRPGSSGKYKFALANSQDYEVIYEFTLKPEFSKDSEKYFPIKFRLRMNNILLETEEWRNVYNLSFAELCILPGATQVFTLEWEWPFESGNDEKDTYLGTKGESVSMVLRIGAQAR